MKWPMKKRTASGAATHQRRHVIFLLSMMISLSSLVEAWIAPMSLSARSSILQSPVKVLSPQRISRTSSSLLRSSSIGGSGTGDGNKVQEGEDHHPGDDSNSEAQRKHQQREQHILEEGMRQFRIAQVQEKIDKLLNDPINPPFDAETELKKVVSISPPLIEEGTPEYALEEQVSAMEDQLYTSLKTEDYETASSLSKDISQMHIDDCGQVLQVNARYYDCFSRKDLSAMQQLWLADRSCICIHPSHAPLMGSSTIMRSWKKMFASGNGAFQKNWMEPQNIRMTVKATTAIVTCDEYVYARRFVQGKKRETELLNKLVATNIFHKVNNQWHMTYHHASWHADSEAAKRALLWKKGGDEQLDETTKAGLERRRDAQLLKAGAFDDDDEDDDDNEGQSAMDSVMGVSNFGPIMDSGSKTDTENGPDGTPQRRVVMGSLSDLLSGNLEGLLGEGGNPGAGAGGGDNHMNNHMNNLNGSSFSLPNGGSGMIRFHSKMNQADLDDEDDDDDDHHDDSAMQMIKSWKAGEGDNKSSSNKSSKKGNKSSSMTQMCIAKLRKLTKEGRLSAKHKKVLLADIVQSTSRGDTSMVEVAYDLLYVDSDVVSVSYDGDTEEDNDDDDDYEEEFAEQCVDLAESIEERRTRGSEQRLH